MADASGDRVIFQVRVAGYLVLHDIAVFIDQALNKSRTNGGVVADVQRRGGRRLVRRRAMLEHVVEAARRRRQHAQALEQQLRHVALDVRLVQRVRAYFLRSEYRYLTKCNRKKRIFL